MSDGKSHVGWGSNLLNITLAFILICTQSWVANGVQGSALFEWWSGGFVCNAASCACSFWVVQICLLAVSLGCAYWLYHRRRSFMPVHIQHIGQPGKIHPHQVLILTLSRCSWQWTPNKLERDKGEHCDLPDDLAGALPVMEQLGEREKFSWEQLLRAIDEHKSELQHIVLIGSKGKQGTVQKVEQCEKMIRHYFPLHTTLTFEQREADFESLDELLGVYRNLVDSNKNRKKDVMIDVTGGTKVVSIAAAMVSLEYPEIEFQYVETSGNKCVRSFNVTTPSQISEG